jgi:hypothetical protein
MDVLRVSFFPWRAGRISARTAMFALARDAAKSVEVKTSSIVDKLASSTSSVPGAAAEVAGAAEAAAAAYDRAIPAVSRLAIGSQSLSGVERKAAASQQLPFQKYALSEAVDTTGTAVFTDGSSSTLLLTRGRPSTDRKKAGGRSMDVLKLNLQTVLQTLPFDATAKLDVLPCKEGAVPPFRWAHSFTALSTGSFLLFGGFSSEFNFSDGWLLTLGSTASAQNAWRHLDGSGPSARAYHSAVAFKGQAVLFGGQFCDGGSCEHLSFESCAADNPVSLVLPDVYYNEVWLLNEARQWSQPQTSGPTPASRAQHTCVVIGAEMWVHGGSNATTLFGDTWILNLHTWTWRKRDCFGEKVRPACFALLACGLAQCSNY